MLVDYKPWLWKRPSPENGMIGMWEPHGLGWPNFRMLEIFLFARDGLNAGVSSLIPDKNGAQWRATLPRITAKSAKQSDFPLFFRSQIVQNHQSGVGEFRLAQQTPGGLVAGLYIMN